MPAPGNPFGPIEADWLPARPAPRKHENGPCPYAVQFSAFAAEIIDAVKLATEQVHINRAKLLTAEQYMRMRRTLPAAHRDKTRLRHGHYCVYDVLIATWEMIERWELTIAPPSLALPPPMRVVPARSEAEAEHDKPKDEPGLLDAVTIHKLILMGE